MRHTRVAEGALALSIEHKTTRFLARNGRQEQITAAKDAAGAQRGAAVDNKLACIEYLHPLHDIAYAKSTYIRH